MKITKTIDTYEAGIKIRYEIEYPKIISQTKVLEDGTEVRFAHTPDSKPRKEYTDKKGTYIKIRSSFWHKDVKVYR